MSVYDILWILVKNIFALCVTAIIGYATRLYYVHRKYDHIPGPPRNSFWTGNLNLIKDSMVKNGHFYPAISQMVKDYGHTIKLFIFHRVMIYTVHKEAIKELLVMGKLGKAKDYDDIRIVCGERAFGNSIVMEADNDKWTWKRSHFNPIFTRSFIGEKYQTFLDISDTLVTKLKKQANGQTKVIMLDEIKRATLDAIAQIYFGDSWNAITEEKSPINDAFLTFNEGWSNFMNKLTFRISPMYRGERQKVRRALEYVRTVGKSYIEKRKIAKKNGEEIPNDFITMLVNMSDQYPELPYVELLDDFFLLCVAGHETTATALSFLLQILGNNPDILEKVRKEIDESIGQKSDFTWNQVNKLTYLDAVIKETLRLYPPAGETARALDKDFIIDGIVIPAGTDVKVSMHVSSRLDDAFENPEKFDPERFLDGNRSSTVYNYFPFSLGPRSCVGKYFAKVETKVLIVKFLQAFTYELDPDTPQTLTHILVLCPEHGVVVRLKPYDSGK